MAKYKNIKESIIDDFLGKVFKQSFKRQQSQALKSLKKKDPKLAKDLEAVQNLYAKNRERLSKMSKDEREKELKDTADFIRSL